MSLLLGPPCAAQVWTSIGPTPNTVGNTGRVTAVAADPSDSTHWLAGAATGGVWESHDSGLNWTSRTDAQPTLATGAIAFAPSNTKIVYAGTGEVGFALDAFAGLGLLKSVDGGTTWTLIQTPSMVRASVAAIRVHPSDPNTLVAATTRGRSGRYGEPVPSPPEYGVLRSTNGGTTWTLTLSGEVTALDVDPANFNNQYAGIGNPDRPADGPAFPRSRDNGVYRSTDGGQTWSVVNGPWSLIGGTTGRIALAVAGANSNTVYAGIQNPNLPNGASRINGQGLLGLFRTDNAWAPTPAWIRVPTEATGPTGYCDRQCGSAHSIVVDPSDANTVIAGGNVLWRCRNCGSLPSWTNISAGAHADHRILFWRGNRLIGGNDGGVVSSTDRGDTWQIHNTTLTAGQFFSGALHPTNPNFVLGGLKDEGCLLWTGGITWRGSPGGYAHADAGQTDFVPSCEGEIAISSTRPETDWMSTTFFPHITRTLDGGVTASAANGGIDEPVINVTAPVRKCPRKDDVFLAGGRGLWRTDNFFTGSTVSWVANAPATGSTIRGIAFAESDATCNTYAYGTTGGQIRLTTNGGRTWTDLDSGKALPTRGVNALAFDPNNPEILYLGFSGFNMATPAKPGHLFKTSNARAPSPAWVNVGPAVDLPHEVITIDPSDPKSVFLGTDAGLWHSIDSGISWQRMGVETGMPNVPVYDIRINPATKRAVAFTFGRGAYMLVGFGFQGPPAPITIRSVSSGATYNAGGLVPGSWAQVQGNNLSSVTRIWNDADFVGLANKLPTKLSGVEVKVSDVSAAVYYVSPTQVSFQVPSGIIIGPAGFALASSPQTVVVFRDGMTSNLLTTTATSSSPGIFPVIVNGKNYPAGVFLDGKYVGDPAIGPAFRKAKPGDVIQLFATGIFRTPAGIVAGAGVCCGVTVTIGEITFAADAFLVAAGQFQINFRVPQQFANLPEGDYPISIQVKFDQGVTSSPATINSDPPGPVVLPIQH